MTTTSFSCSGKKGTGRFAVKAEAPFEDMARELKRVWKLTVQALGEDGQSVCIEKASIEVIDEGGWLRVSQLMNARDPRTGDKTSKHYGGFNMPDWIYERIGSGQLLDDAEEPRLRSSIPERLNLECDGSDDALTELGERVWKRLECRDLARWDNLDRRYTFLPPEDDD